VQKQTHERLNINWCCLEDAQHEIKCSVAGNLVYIFISNYYFLRKIVITFTLNNIALCFITLLLALKVRDI